MKGEIDPLKQQKESEYQKDYYERKKAEIAAKKASRWKTDPEYRQQIQERSRERKRRLAEEKRALNGGTVTRGPMKPTQFRINVGGKEIVETMYSAGALGKMVGRTTQTIRLWEKKGILPESLYRSPTGVRLYTEFQVRRLKSALEEARRIDGAVMVKERIASTSFPRLAKQIWEEFPLGVDPNG